MTENKPGRRIVVCGGGVTGWVTALFIHRLHQTLRQYDGIYPSITVIETPERGALDAEGSLPAVVPVFDYLDIPVSHLVKEAGATIQNGTRFTNWRADTGSYFHSFPAIDNYSLANHEQGYHESISSTPLIGAIAIHGDLSKAMLNGRLAEAGKVPAIRRLDRVDALDPRTSDPIWRYEQVGAFSIHFDFEKITTFLRRVAASRGIHATSGVIADVDYNGAAGLPDELAENVRIERVKLVDGRSFECDDVLDCTGTSRRIIGQVLAGSYRTFRHRLPVDRALILPPAGRSIDPEPFSEATAMRSGWRWAWPTEHTDSTGYAFSSSYCSEDEAAREMTEEGYDTSNATLVEFDAGVIETPWVGNCLAVGTAAGFVEPLESTSLWLALESLRFAFADRSGLVAPQAVRNEYNRLIVGQFEKVVDFLELHYYTDRADTQFWKERTVCDNTRSLIELWRHRPPSFLDTRDWLSPFDIASISQVAFGNGLVDLDATVRTYHEHSQRHNIAGQYDQIRYNFARVVEQASSHDDFLQALRDAIVDI